MANKYIENLESKLDLNNTFQRVFPQPIDRSSIFGSLEDAQNYAKGDGTDERKLGGTSYVGQIITVYENNEIDVYKINYLRDLEPLGEGKGVIIVNNESEAKIIAAKDKSVGNLILRLDNKTMYIVIDKNVFIEMYYFNDNNEIIVDSGEF